MSPIRDRWTLALALLLLVALLLVIAVPVFATPPSGRRDVRAVEATQNVYRVNAGPVIRRDVARALERADVVRLQEVVDGRPTRAVRGLLADRPNWRGVFVGRVEVPILWDRREFRQMEPPGVRRLTERREGRGWPARFITWVALEHVATGRVLTVANVHPLPRYCRIPHDAERQADARTHWTGVRDWTRRQMARHPGRPVLLGGDFNCRLTERARWYFPGRILDRAYRFDRSGSIDRLVTSRTIRRPVGLRRWALPAASDHRLQLRALRVR